MPTSLFNDLRKTNGVVQAFAVVLEIPAFGNYPESVISFGTTDFECNGVAVIPCLREFPSIKTQMGSGQDTADAFLIDMDSLIYQQLKPYQDVLELSKVTIYECLSEDGGYFEPDEIFNGVVDSFSYSDQDFGISLSFVSSTSVTGNLIGGRILTQRHCSARFNVNGLLSPEEDACGWQTSQGGNPIFCSHKRKGKDGCEDHNNPQRIVSVEELATTSLSSPIIGNGGDGFGYGGGSGWGYSSGNCFSADNLVWMNGNKYKRIEKIAVSDEVVCFDETGKLYVRPIISIKEVYEKDVEVLELEFELSGQLKYVTPGHRFYMGDGNFQQIGKFDVGNSIVCYDVLLGWRALKITGKKWSERTLSLYNFTVQDFPTYFVKSGNFNLPVHNIKNVFLDRPVLLA